MGKKLYVGNLPFSATEQVLAETFAECGTVESARVITDRDTGRSKGFGFVEMSNDQEAQEAINKFNGADWAGRPMTVNEARPQAPREGGGGGGGGRSGGGGFGGGGRSSGGGGGGSRW
jgi:RNA recognition motif-containing protein